MARKLARNASKSRHAKAVRRRRRNGVSPAPGGALAPAVVRSARAQGTTRLRAPSIRLLSELALIVVLALTLGFSWRDGTTNDGDVFASPHATSNPVAGLGTGRELHSRAALVTVASSIPAPGARIPTARPVELLIPALDVHRAVEQVGVDRSGWYQGGPIPGAPGDAVIEGHAGYPGQPMIFGRLISLRPGDRIIVVLADGSRQLFLVESISSIAVGAAPPDMGLPYGPPRLTLITCTGHFDKSSYSYSRRLVLEATYAGPA